MLIVNPHIVALQFDFMIIRKVSDLIKKYKKYTDKTGVALVGHPCLEEVRSAPLLAFKSLYTDNDIGLINPVESRWWKAIAEFVGVELSPDFPLPKEAENHYYFGVYC